MKRSFLYFKNSNPNHLLFMTTRVGGYSLTPYNSFNLGLYADDSDNKDHLRQNFNHLLTTQNINKLITLKQTHSNIIYKVDHDNLNNINTSKGDGLFTVDRGIALGVFTADCYPVILVGDKGIAALHLGWRGLNRNIIENAIPFFEAENDYPKQVFIGAGISRDAYTVQDDIFDELDKRYDIDSVISIDGDKGYKFDLQKMIINALRINKIYDYETLDTCTLLNKELFFSYRRDHGVTGRHLTVIMKK